MNKLERAQKLQKKPAEKPVAAELQEQLSKKLDEDPEFSLSADPTDKYSMSEEQKRFIESYVQLKSLPMAAELSGISLDTAKAYFVSYSSQQEIRRINRALYQKQFSAKMLTLDEIGSWLSSLMTDEDVPLADRLSSKDKLNVAKTLIDLIAYKEEVVQNPAIVIDADIESEIKDLSVKSIKALISQKQKPDQEKKKADEALSGKLSPEEEAFLKTLPAKDILKLIDDVEKQPADEKKAEAAPDGSKKIL